MYIYDLCIKRYFAQSRKLQLLTFVTGTWLQGCNDWNIRDVINVSQVLINLEQVNVGSTVQYISVNSYIRI